MDNSITNIVLKIIFSPLALVFRVLAKLSDVIILPIQRLHFLFRCHSKSFVLGIYDRIKGAKQNRWTIHQKIYQQIVQKLKEEKADLDFHTEFIIQMLTIEKKYSYENSAY
ncbi:hypothetical protein [Bernardetia sp.]|uniref:hypothetical protein n=1 Tax=Bernardetia sp. TaxID=1937974 RepID=UPI0025BD3490|nr:hypothetical protein [Bernardetia sp.]